jgi:carbamoyl-phosphate synthase small subunit
LNSLFDPAPRAVLVLQDGTLFEGVSIGAEGSAVGEVVFNTAITGYQEILTDPSYSNQLVTLTYPHIGNVGVNPDDAESDQIHAAGLIVHHLPPRWSNYRGQMALDTHLRESNVVGIAGIDTRRLTRLLRSGGAQNGAIITGNTPVEHALRLARNFPGLVGADLAKLVTTKRAYAWKEAEYRFDDATGQHGYGPAAAPRFDVVAYDFGVKHNILRMLAQRGCRLTVVRAQTPAETVMAMRPDGIFLSNGPGDPEPCDYAIRAIRRFLDAGIPTFGVCLGHQLMALASGAQTTKMPFGHHGANHPVQDLRTGQVIITSQNHGFAVDAASLPDNCRPTHMSLFDGSLQGFERTDRPAFCFQGHPEASPGPQDISPLFDRFVSLMEVTRAEAQ